jgi:tetratricopeptide (TPR) repeat protein
MSEKKNKSILNFIPLFFVVFTFVGLNSMWGQNRFMLNDGESVKFKLAKQLFDKGKMFLAEGKLDRAERAFLKSLEVFPRYSHSAYHLGQIYYKKRNYLKALENIERAKKNFKYISTFGVNSQLEYFSKLREQRKNLWEEVTDMQYRIDSKNFKGRTEEERYVEYSELRGKVNHGKETLRRIDELLRSPVVQEAKMPADYFYLHGNILFRLKKYQDAYFQYLEAVRIEPCYVDAYTNLANLNYIGRRYEEALAYLEKAEKCGSGVDEKFKRTVLKALGREGEKGF